VVDVVCDHCNKWRRLPRGYQVGAAAQQSHSPSDVLTRSQMYT
jgi:hypothetical protein